jgi:hypothetical protein
MMFFHKKPSSKPINQRDQLINLFYALSDQNQEKISFLVRISNLLYKTIMEKFMPMLVQEHKKTLTNIQTEMVFYFIGKCIKIRKFDTCNILKLPSHDAKIDLMITYKNMLTSILINSINKDDKRNNLFNIMVDNDILMSFIQLLVMIYYFDKKEYTGSLFSNYEKTFSIFYFIVNEYFDIIYETLFKNKIDVKDRFLNSIGITSNALIDTYIEIIQEIMKNL